jgi:hypothetical protein
VAAETGEVMAMVGAVVSAVVRVMFRVAMPELPAASRAVTVMMLEPLSRVIPEADQLVVPVAVPLPPRLLAQVTWVTPTLSEAVPAMFNDAELVLYVAVVTGAENATVGAVASEGVQVTVKVATPEFPAPSRAVTGMMLEPLSSVMPATDQLVVPVAVPLPPRLLAQVTWVTPTLSEAVPAMFSDAELVLYVAVVTGAENATVGAVASEGVQVTVKVATPEFPAPSRAVTVMMLEPLSSVMPATDQLVVPVAVPLPPRLLAQAT